MYSDFFSNLAHSENGEFYTRDEIVPVGRGVRSPQVLYKITFSYRQNQFSIVMHYGISNTGHIKCQLDKNLRPKGFKINATFPLFRFLSSKNKGLKIISSNASIDKMISQNKYFHILNEIALKENFNPSIICEFENGWNLEAKYHLEFLNWTSPIKPIIELFKFIIDEYDKKLL